MASMHMLVSKMLWSDFRSLINNVHVS